ncbi:hypothetical protein NKH71_09255 [Mesorhizobium sp. M0983]|uniref:hypothetical protein n=1 Tax=unclassified Mesorhizobium TaxID=325217 RepID=UPI00333AB0CE
MADGKLDVLLRVPKHIGREFAEHWDEIRAAEGISPDHKLRDSDDVERFDAGAMVEWLVPLTNAVGPIITGVLGYLVAKRGEIEIGEMKFKNISVADIKEIITFIDGRKKD